MRQPDAVTAGQILWSDLAAPFNAIAKANGFTDHVQLAQLYAGFIAALTGAMAGQLGTHDTCVVLHACIDAAHAVGKTVTQ